MRTHTNGYKTSIKGIRKINTILTNVDTSTVILNDDLVKVKPILNTDLLKSVMKELDIESKTNISLNTIVNFQHGVYVNNAYEYMNYGNYVVYQSEYQADTKTYKITCYDKMLYSMVDYESLGVTYPITIRNYIKAIATKLGLDFANENDEFVNYNKEIPNELYLDSLGRSLGYTFRDVLDELSQVTASNICINDDDELEVRYINDTTTSAIKTGTNITITDNKLNKAIDMQLLGNLEQDGTPTTSVPIPIDVATGLQNITINDTTYQINLGKNLFSGFSSIGSGNTYADGVLTVNNNRANRSNNIKVKPNTIYYFNYTASTASRRYFIYEYNSAGTQIKSTTKYAPTNITTDSATSYIVIGFAPQSGTTYPFTITDFQFELGNQATTYAEYFTPIELCEIVNNQDKIYKSSDKWYIDKEIGKIDSYNGEIITTDYISTTGGLDTGATIYYVLATPTTTEITDATLINQLNILYNAQLNIGTNNIGVIGSLASIFKIEYVDSFETINEDYLKNINVTFGEKYGPVNSIVLSRSADSDNIYKKDDESIEENGLCELKISDNQILNFNDRSSYLQEIFDQLNGLEYYINDFDSPGITYLELLDRYSVQIGDNTYSCIMLNDEITIDKGIEERIYTDALEESITDYKKSDKIDQKINQAYLIVNKQNQTIEALTSRTDTIENNETNHYNELVDKFDDYAPISTVDTITNQVTQLQSDTYTKTQIQEIANGTGVDGVKVTAVVSTEAQFDKDGMHYSKTDAPTSSTIDYKGFEVDDKNNNEIFYAGYDEDVNSATYGTSIVRSDNINVDTYLQFGNNKGRFEEFTDSDGNTGIGLFLM